MTNPEVSVVPTAIVGVVEAVHEYARTVEVRINPFTVIPYPIEKGVTYDIGEQVGVVIKKLDSFRLAHQTPPATQPSATVGEVEAITAAITAADADFSYSYRLTGLNDGVEEHTLLMPGFEPATFSDRQDGYAVIAERRNRLRAEAVLAILHTPPPVATATVVEAEKLRAALGLALHYLVQNEPGDSRAVSDEFVAMAAIHAGLGGDKAMAVILAATPTPPAGGQ